MAFERVKTYRCILFDLDHTLWDYETNSRETLVDLYERFDLAARGVPDREAFCAKFTEVNTSLWTLYDFGKIGSEVIRNDRFFQILSAFAIDDRPLSRTLSESYIKECPTKPNVMPQALETVANLAERYPLTVVTNGFEETQYTKLSVSGLAPFFKHVVTSQRAGFKKPAKEIFNLALALNLARPSDAVMVGDNLVTDISGARNASIDTIYFNPEKIGHKELVSYEIEHMSQLAALL